MTDVQSLNTHATNHRTREAEEAANALKKDLQAARAQAAEANTKADAADKCALANLSCALSREF